MCMTRCYKYYPNRRNKKPTKIVKRWKFLTFEPEANTFSTLFNSSEPFGKWIKASSRSYRLGPRWHDLGFHVYKTKPSRLKLSPPGTLVEVEVSGLLATGRGDGYGHHKCRVETYNWMRVTKP